ncbi:MAG TPA: LPS assembly lipoprotein LptE [Hypericibacter adhaerens]|uniref:LPS assembly lipoprotein LptE n=1 Tax=Hypericibacter adhaerens TaxID=2602016 RepID=UPI002B8E93CB|nr:LPS assembly lipoprotein LptE [Hypericibacter adhaerens]HWA44557.1 LPS assembly lipoprotein LptE [Hypericibacter adhaerens]
MLLRLAPVLLLALAGCGWEPLYARPAPDPTSGGVSAKLATIAIDPIDPTTSLDPLTGNQRSPYDSRAAQLLQNHLRDGLNPYGPPSAAAYHLGIKLRDSLFRAAALGNGDSTRDDLLMVARYQLTNEKGDVVFQDEARVITSYDVLNEPFSDLQSHNDALQRAVEQLAEAIQTRLAVYLEK